MDTADKKELRNFGLLTGAIIAVLFGALIPSLRARPYPVWPWAAGGFLIVSGAAFPAVLKHPFAVWSAVGGCLGWINSRLILGALFFGVVTPLGLLMKLLGRDAMARGFDHDAQTYRVPSRRAPTENFEKPY